VTKLEECNTVTGMVRYEQQLLTCHCDCHCQTARLIRPKNKKYQTNRDQKETLERPSRGGQGPMENSCCWRQLEEQADRVSVSVFSAGGFGTWFLENGGPVDRYGPFFSLIIRTLTHRTSNNRGCGRGPTAFIPFYNSGWADVQSVTNGQSLLITHYSVGDKSEVLNSLNVTFYV
jgi:hypothetical protein